LQNDKTFKRWPAPFLSLPLFRTEQRKATLLSCFYTVLIYILFCARERRCYFFSHFKCGDAKTFPTTIIGVPQREEIPPDGELAEKSSDDIFCCRKCYDGWLINLFEKTLHTGACILFKHFSANRFRH